jgi:hypothetical protein
MQPVNHLRRRRRTLAKFKTILNSEAGSIESGLVLIPLLALFLATLQLIATVNLRNVDLAVSQNQASRQAVLQVTQPDDELIELNSGDFFSRLRLLIVHTKRDLPNIFPGINSLMGGKTLQTSGIAVFEESEECVGGYLVC